MKKVILSLLCLGFLAACAEEPVPVQVNYTLPPKMAFDVQTISLIDEAGSLRSSSPYSTNNFKPQIGEAVQQWAKDRLEATGSSGQMTVIIRDATLSSEALPLETGMNTWFKRQQASKYMARVVVEVSARKDGEYAKAVGEAKRWVTLPEDPTPEERRDAYFTLLNGLMKDFGTNIEENIKNHMRSFAVGTGGVTYRTYHQNTDIGQ